MIGGPHLVGFGDDEASALGRLARAGFPVPPGFTVSAAAHAEYDAAGGEMPEAIAGRIIAAYGGLGSGTYVAVRSPGATFLDVSSSGRVLDAVRRCWATVGDAGPVTVVVQQMVAAVASGTMTTGGEIVVRAAWGLDTAVTTPDEYVLDASDLRIAGRTLGSKEQRRVRDPATGLGTAVQDVPPADRERPALTDEQAAELADLGRRAQALDGDAPHHIGWALADGGFHLLHCEKAKVTT